VAIEVCVLMTVQPMSSAPSLMVVSDLDDMYIPLAGGCLVDPLESRSQVEALLNMLPRISAEKPDGDRVAAGSAVKGALAGLVSSPLSNGPLSPFSSLRYQADHKHPIALSRWSDQFLPFLPTHYRPR
jgi:hypothetical protein